MAYEELLDVFMPGNPDEMNTRRQRAVAERLRGMGQIGAMGSTSQISEISDTGKNMMAQPFAYGEKMSDLRENQKDRDSLERRTRASALGRTTGKQFIGTAPERAATSKDVGAVGRIKTLVDSFKPEYAMQGDSGYMARAVNRGQRTEPKIAGKIEDFTRKWTPTGVSEFLYGELPEGMTADKFNYYDDKGKVIPEEQAQAEIAAYRQEASDWWARYDLLYQMGARHELFGATMTPTEAKTWDSATINPGTSPELASRHLNTLLEIASNKAHEAIQTRIAEGWSQAQIDNYKNQLEQALGGDLDKSADKAVVEKTEDMEESVEPEADVVESSPMPDVIPDAQWLEYDGADREQLLGLFDAYGADAVQRFLEDMSGVDAAPPPTSALPRTIDRRGRR